MEEKVKKLEEIRERSHTLDPKKNTFPGELKDLAQEALGYCESPDDDQEIHWLKSAIKLGELQAREKDLSEEGMEQRDHGLSYLLESLDSIILREKKYLD